jgi:hypothetical protein
MNNTTLTQFETKVLAALKQNADDCSGGDFAIMEGFKVPGLNQQQLGGVVTSLTEKKLIAVDVTYVNAGWTVGSNGRPRRTRGDKVTQVTFFDATTGQRESR